MKFLMTTLVSFLFSLQINASQNSSEVCGIERGAIESIAHYSVDSSLEETRNKLLSDSDLLELKSCAYAETHAIVYRVPGINDDRKSVTRAIILDNEAFNESKICGFPRSSFTSVSQTIDKKPFETIKQILDGIDDQRYESCQNGNFTAFIYWVDGQKRAIIVQWFFKYGYDVP